MLGPSGPDDETWAKMSPTARRIYFSIVAVIASSIIGLLVLKAYDFGLA